MANGAQNPEDMLRDMQQYATVRQEPTNHEYAPPAGHPRLLKLPESARIYEVGEPTKQTDLLVGYERRHIIPIAMMIAPIFGTVPVPDDVYRLAPPYAQNNLFCVISRSGIRRIDSILVWDAVVVVVQKLCIVRINCSLNPRDDVFSILKIMLWSSKQQDYSIVQDPEAPSIDPSVIPYIMDRYAGIENIT